MRKILIFGIGGFIGANLAEHFNSKGWQVIGVSRKRSWRVNELLSDNVIDANDFIGFDITRYHNGLYGLDDIFDEAQADVVINTAVCGAYSTQTNPDDIYKTNVIGTINVTEAAIKQKNNTLVINTGSNSEIFTNDAYSISKRLASKYVSDRAKTALETKIINLRLFSVYGYFEDKQRLFPQIMLNAMEGKPTKISNPKNTRNFTFIEDVCDAYEQVIKRKDTLESGNSFDIPNNPKSIEEVMRVAKVIFNNPEFEISESVSREMDKVSYTSIHKFGNDELGWYPKHVELIDGMFQMKRWMEKNKELYK